MNHRMWDERDVQAMTSTDVANEHNALHNDWEAASKTSASHDEFWTVGNIMALGAREVVRRHEEDMKAARQPVTDAMIEKMAEAACNDLRVTDSFDKTCWTDGWRSAIRAALAAIGPQYCPSDVGFASRVPELEAKIKRQRNMLASVGRTIESKNAALAELRAQLDARAVIDAPAGVPSVAECSALAEKSLRNAQLGGLGDGEQRYVMARDIRDAVLAGISTPVWTDDQIEALARVLHKAANQSGEFPKPDFEKVPPIEKDRLLLLARTAVEFMRAAPPETPKGLPRLMQIEDAYYAQSNAELEPIEFTLNYLRPWLHTPTGWELDVTEQEAARAYCPIIKEKLDPLGINWMYSAAGLQAVLDLCRSRIRPTFECAECAKLRGMLSDVTHYFDKVAEIRDNAARAALEGE